MGGGKCFGGSGGIGVPLYYLLLLQSPIPITEVSLCGIQCKKLLETRVPKKKLCCNSMNASSNFLIWLYILRPKANWLPILVKLPNLLQPTFIRQLCLEFLFPNVLSKLHIQ